MNENFIITLVQGINTAIMNLLVLLLFTKIYKPKYEGKKVYIFSYIVTTILYVTVNIIVAKIGIPIINLIYTSIYINIYCFIMFKCDYKKAFIINESFIMFGLMAEVLAGGFCTIIGNKSMETAISSSQNMTIICLESVHIKLLQF